jgi:hypothetical protein
MGTRSGLITVLDIEHNTTHGCRGADRSTRSPVFGLRSTRSGPTRGEGGAVVEGRREERGEREENGRTEEKSGRRKWKAGRREEKIG